MNLALDVVVVAPRRRQRTLPTRSRTSRSEQDAVLDAGQVNGRQGDGATTMESCQVAWALHTMSSWSAGSARAVGAPGEESGLVIHHSGPHR